jgi:SAM-dependent methyltransferase
MARNLTATNWDKAYEAGKYRGETAIPLVQDILSVLHTERLTDQPGFYPGCGNGRNYIPLYDTGLHLSGNDISAKAIELLKKQRPEADVSVGNFLDHTPSTPYAYLLSIQLFQHADLHTMHRLFAKTTSLLRPSGLFVLRVNATHTEIIEDHEVFERSPQGSFTIRYQSGQKKGQAIHFYTAEEITVLTQPRYTVAMPLREAFMERSDGTRWAQWETILRKN